MISSDADIRGLLANTRTIAVVGLSDNPAKASYYVSEYLQAKGYRIIPVNPAVSAVLGEKCYPSLRDIPEPVDLVDVFRRPDAVPEIVEDAIAVRANAVWLQEGVVHPVAAARAEAAGLKVVMDRCVLKEHERLI